VLFRHDSQTILPGLQQFGREAGYALIPHAAASRTRHRYCLPLRERTRFPGAGKSEARDRNPELGGCRKWEQVALVLFWESAVTFLPQTVLSSRFLALGLTRLEEPEAGSGAASFGLAGVCHFGMRSDGRRGCDL